jgi:transcription elongation factor GreA
VNEPKAEQLTPEQRAALEAELAQLEGPERTKIVDAIATARGHGDLSENFAYHDAKDDQGLLERRIAILRDRIENAEILDEAAVDASDSVTVGSTVVIEAEDGQRMEIQISSVGGVSPDAPLGKALLGKKVGDVADVDAPRGAWRARVVSIGH